MSEEMTQVLVALHGLEQGQQTLGQRFQKLEQGFQKLEQGFQTLDQGFQTLEQRIQTLEQSVQKLEQGLQKLDDAHQRLYRELITTRADIMERIDRLQDKLSMVRDDIVVNYGSIDRVEAIARNGTQQSQMLADQVSLMMKRILGIDRRLNALEEKGERPSAA